MDSEDSRPGSAASNSSAQSSENSRQSYSIGGNEDDGGKSPVGNVESPKNGKRNSRSASRGSNDGGGSPCSPRSPSKSDSDSSSSASSSDNEEDDAVKTQSGNNNRKGSTGGSSSEGSSPKRQSVIGSRNASESPGKSPASSRNSSLSSNRSRSHSRSNSPEQRGTDDNTNISHDLSDVSDIESDKQVSSINNSKQSDEGDGAPISKDPTPLVEENAVTGEGKRRSSLDYGNNGEGVITDLRQKLDQKKNLFKTKDQQSVKDDGDALNAPIIGVRSGEEDLDLVKAHDEDALDFEAEEGECPDVGNKDEEKKSLDGKSGQKDDGKTKSEKSDGEAEEGEELEEGEVSDEDEKRPEETEPKPVCRFYTRGQCTWGMSCRFLHPGVTDKGNYTMFDLVRPVSVPQTGGAGGSRSAPYSSHAADYHDYRSERPVLHHRPAAHHPPSIYGGHHESRPLVPDGPVVVESAWERGLRTAKEMMRKANKRKEQDMDFEDKKMNLTLSPDELEKEAYYLKDRVSPENATAYGRYGHPMYQDAPSGVHSPPDRFSRGGAPMLPYDEIDTYGRTTRYRELPPHRMPQYEDERRVRPTREVIVQRVEPVGRGDEWNDPWMRSKSPGGRGLSRERGDKRRRDRRSYSSNSSYSSSSSSQSDSSSDSSRSPSPVDHRRRYNSGTHKSPPPSRRHGIRAARSPSPPARKSKRSPTAFNEQSKGVKNKITAELEALRTGGLHHSPTTKRRGHMGSPPTQDKRGAYSPAHKRKKLSPPSKKALNEKSKGRRHQTSSSSGSGSSDSSASDSDSDSGSSSSDSSSQSRGRSSLKQTRAPERMKDRKLAKKVEPPKKRSPISIEIKKQNTVGTSALLASSPTHSITSEKDTKKSRREELLKQLRAVEDAIAKKRSKLA